MELSALSCCGDTRYSFHTSRCAVYEPGRRAWMSEIEAPESWKVVIELLLQRQRIQMTGMYAFKERRTLY